MRNVHPHVLEDLVHKSVATLPLPSIDLVGSVPELVPLNAVMDGLLSDDLFAGSAGSLNYNKFLGVIGSQLLHALLDLKILADEEADLVHTGDMIACSLLFDFLELTARSSGKEHLVEVLLVGLEDEFDGLVMGDVLLTTANHVVFLLVIIGDQEIFIKVIGESPDVRRRVRRLLRFFFRVFVLADESHEALVPRTGSLVSVHRQAATTSTRMEFVGLLEAELLGILVPFAVVRMGVSAAAGLTAHRAGSACPLSLLESFLHSHTLQQLHVEVAGEDQANIVSDLGVGVDCNHYGDLTLVEGVSNHFRVTS
mmetsp:Transcript_11730/g.17950  ORF Transcript_11730/g.17950 Transcript_11730/m.17950 type:complete len:311 (+) Transcript_11730:2383-3315(+)